MYLQWVEISSRIIRQCSGIYSWEMRTFLNHTMTACIVNGIRFFYGLNLKIIILLYDDNYYIFVDNWV